jgi:hypothetical protein
MEFIKSIDTFTTCNIDYAIRIISAFDAKDWTFAGIAAGGLIVAIVAIIDSWD